MDGIIEVAGGKVQGRERHGIWVFTGIPYARSPEGALRWRPPQPPEPWSGVRPATEFGPIAPQAADLGGFAMPGEPDVQSEDCLSLNVWTPMPDDAHRPVMVFLHGGGFTGGSGAGLVYRGGDLARNGDVVVVTLNYRLGALGFLGHPSLVEGVADPEAIGNWGLLDQLAALRWVRDHISSFGGDPGQVTLFGESAGGMSIAAIFGSPRARGLFHRAIIESGPALAHSLDQAVGAAESMAEILGLGPGDLRREVLESVPAPDLVAAAQQMQARGPARGQIPLPFLPTVDGTFLPVHPAEAFERGSAVDVPLLLGTNRDEFTFFGLGDPRLASMDEAGLVKWIEHWAPELSGSEVIEAYREARGSRGETTTVRDLWIGIASDWVFRWPTLRMAASHRRHQPSVHVYLFTWATPVLGGELGSCHALELPFVFGSVRRPELAAFSGGGPEADLLSSRMQEAWLSFARSGDPAHEGIGEWPTWDTARRATMIFGRECGVVDAPRDEELGAFSERLALSG